MLRYVSALSLLLLCSCSGQNSKIPERTSDTISKDSVTVAVVKDTMKKAAPAPVEMCDLEKQLIAAGLVNIQDLDSTIIVRLKYSTTDNFMKTDVYGHLQNCYLQRETANRLKDAQSLLRMRRPGYSLVIYDGVRPLHIQQLMWDTVDLPVGEKQKYLSNPKWGSIHNYGAAVDLSILDEHGNAIDMGTPFDHFGRAAHTDSESVLLAEKILTEEQIANRRLLRNVMRDSGFFGIQTEWWHFNSCRREEAAERYKIVE